MDSGLGLIFASDQGFCLSENNGFWIHKLCVNLTFIVKWRSFP